MSEDDLRQEAMAAAFQHRQNVPELGPGEFTVRDWQEFVTRQGDGREINGGTAQRELLVLVAQGKLRRAERIDPRTKRRVWGFYQPGDGPHE